MKCPHCDRPLSQISIKAVTLNGGKGAKWNGLNYFCPLCLKILSVGFDPLALQADLLEQVKSIVRRS
jgi:alkyl hydroperoxide reductase subunit AhpF